MLVWCGRLVVWCDVVGVVWFDVIREGRVRG